MVESRFFFGKLGYLNYEYVNCLVKDIINQFKINNIKLVISVLDPIAATAAKILNLPLVSITQACFHPEKIHSRIRWWEELPNELPNVVNVFNRILSNNSLNTIETVEDLFMSELTIIPSVKEFDPVKDENAFYTGIMSWEYSVNHDIDYNYLFESGKKTICAYTGRMYDSGGKSGLLILENIINAFEDSDYRVIITTGVGEMPDVYKNKQFSNNLRVFEWISISKIINKMDLIIHHGGHGLSLQSILAGKPSLVIPTHDEREYNARQLQELGVGQYIHPERVTPDILRCKASALIEDDAILNNAARCSDKILKSNYIGARGAAELIMKILVNQQTSH